MLMPWKDMDFWNGIAVIGGILVGYASAVLGVVFWMDRTFIRKTECVACHELSSTKFRAADEDMDELKESMHAMHIKLDNLADRQIAILSSAFPGFALGASRKEP